MVPGKRLEGKEGERGLVGAEKGVAAFVGGFVVGVVGHTLCIEREQLLDILHVREREREGETNQLEGIFLKSFDQKRGDHFFRPYLIHTVL